MTTITKTSSTTPAIQISNLTVEYADGGRVVQPITELDLTIGRGEFVCILGPSGQGKSTLLRCIAGLQPLKTGEIVTAGGKVQGPAADRGMVFQHDAIPMWMRVEDNVAFGPRAQRQTKSRYQPLVDHFITEVGLADWRRAWPRQLSGGMRKRVAIAAVFASDPDILLLDEPFGALDHFTREKLQSLLLRLWEETAKTVCFVTHDIDEALVLADRIIILGQGKIALDIEVSLPRPRGDELRADPSANEMRRLLLHHLADRRTT